MGKRLIIVSNRLPYRREEPQGSLLRSVGGLTSALGPLHEKNGSIWVGAADLEPSARTTKEGEDYERMLHELGCLPVYLTREEQKSYYDGFSNSTIWPLFHDFPSIARFEEDTWQAYRQVNEKFCEAVTAVACEDDIIWVQDYHLMLLPALLRAKMPGATIGFFLHIPFPDFETFRMLPWRRQILEGLLGADLIGFHTYDYVRHFLTSCGRIAGLDNHIGSIWVDQHLVQADVFPLGIDYDRFKMGARSEEVRKMEASPIVKHSHEGSKTMLSVERLDYSKGIPDRLRAFDAFLERYPEWIGRVHLTLVTVPSRENVPSYKTLKKQIDELVGRINGKYSTLDWTPLSYYYRPLSFETLCMAYQECDVMLVTPLRDGMNLVAKEYLAVHDGEDGVLILSEMAGAAGELNEAVLVNPFDQNALVEAMHDALTMPKDEQIRRNKLMQRRLRRYTSDKWSHEFLAALGRVKGEQQVLNARILSAKSEERLVRAYRDARRRAILLDYDGTLVPFSNDPASTRPDADLLDVLGRLAADERNEVTILSGRDRTTLQAWLGGLPIGMVAEHGAWSWDRSNRAWTMRIPLDGTWKERIRPILQDFTDRTPGSALEEKDYSLVWHYRACSTELAQRRVTEIKNDLTESIGDLGLQLENGNKIVEVKMANVDKGSAAYRWLSDESYDFLLVCGDDLTDEDMFNAAPGRAWTIKIGAGPTLAHFTLKSCQELRCLLGRLADVPES